MAIYFFDTSAIAKNYHLETGSLQVDTLLNEPQSTFFISRLSVVEMQSVFALKVRTGVLTESEFHNLRYRSLADVANRRLQVIRLLTSHFQKAERLINRYATSRSLRTLDALQSSVALSLRGRNLIDHFVCADKNLCAVAALESLSVINPEQP